MPRIPQPVDAARLEELALAYVARFATSAGKLTAYLARKLRERGWEGDEPPDVDAVVARFVDKGYVDDAGYARAKGQGLLRRGYGARRIDQALALAGIDEDLRREAKGAETERRHAALVLARKRRVGPFAPPGQPTDPALREKQVAAMLRAGHPLEYARRLVDASSPEAAEEWADEDTE